MIIEDMYNFLPVPIIQTDKSGNILFISNESKEVLKLAGQMIPNNVKEIQQLFSNDLMKNEIVICDDNVNKTFSITKVEKTEYLFIIFKEITEEKKLLRENKILKEVLEHITEGVQISDENDVMILYNKSCEKIEGISRKKCVGKKSSELYMVTENTEESTIHRIVLKSGTPVVDKYNQYTTIEGKTVNVITSTYPYYENEKPVAVYSIIRDITKIKEVMQKNIRLQKQLVRAKNLSGLKNGTRFTLDSIVTEDKKFKEVVETSKKISTKNSPILIYGETGTGKELFAQGIHNESEFMSGPFIGINCAAIPESLLEGILFGTTKGAFTNANDSQGLFEQAENGTIFLDEINSMGINLQAKLLRVLQEKTIRRIGDSVEREINCRIISSVNKDPIQSIKDKHIREDLYYRLAGITLYIPPLRERKSDITTLIKYFINKCNNQYGTNVKDIAEELEGAFLKYEWPGNVRELEHIIEGCMNIVDAETNTLNSSHMPMYIKGKFSFKKGFYRQEFRNAKSLQQILDEVEKNVIINNLKRNEGNISKTAKELGLVRQSLQYRIKKIGITTNSVI